MLEKLKLQDQTIDILSIEFEKDVKKKTDILAIVSKINEEQRSVEQELNLALLKQKHESSKFQASIDKAIEQLRDEFETYVKQRKRITQAENEQLANLQSQFGLKSPRPVTTARTSFSSKLRNTVKSPKFKAEVGQDTLT